jgi:RimJ/RimL family protein N-acetyltransferase
MISELSTPQGHPREPKYLSVRLADSSCLRIRLVTPLDREHLVEGFSRLSNESRHTRFFSSMRALQGPVLDKLADLSGYLHVAIGAFTENDDLGHGVAVARAIQPSPGDPAELAITVVDNAQGMGLGRLLLHILMVVMTEIGVASFSATILRENFAAVALFRKLGAATNPDPEDLAITLASIGPGDLSRLTGWPDDLEQRISDFARHVSKQLRN